MKIKISIMLLFCLLGKSFSRGNVDSVYVLGSYKDYEVHQVPHLSIIAGVPTYKMVKSYIRFTITQINKDSTGKSIIIKTTEIDSTGNTVKDSLNFTKILIRGKEFHLWLLDKEISPELIQCIGSMYESYLDFTTHISYLSKSDFYAMAKPCGDLLVLRKQKDKEYVVVSDYYRLTERIDSLKLYTIFNYEKDMEKVIKKDILNHRVQEIQIWSNEEDWLWDEMQRYEKYSRKGHLIMKFKRYNTSNRNR